MSEEIKETTEEVLETNEEQFTELMEMLESSKLPPITIDIEDYDIEEFNRGIEETSYLVGKVTALLNCGLSEQVVIDLILNQETIDYNLKAAEINKQMNVEVAKAQRSTQDKYEL